MKMMVFADCETWFQIVKLGVVQKVVIRTLIVHSVIIGHSMGGSFVCTTAASFEIYMWTPCVVCALDVR